MRDKIQAKAVEMDYHPDPALSALVHYRHSQMETPVRAALAWLNRWPDPKKLRRFREFDLYWQGAQAAAARLGFHLEEFIVDKSITPARMAQILSTRNVRGILIPPGPFAEGWIEQFPWGQFSVVALGRPGEQLPIHMVASDQTSNALLAVRKMQERGYRRIGFVGVPWMPWTSGAGFLWVQALEIPEKLRVPPLLFNHNETDASHGSLKKWLRLHKPDAILTDNPQLPEALVRAGLRIPEDIGLAATTILDCPISAGIYQNPEETGRVSVLMLHSLINDHDRGMPSISRQVMVEGKWVDGASLPPRA